MTLVGIIDETIQINELEEIFDIQLTIPTMINEEKRVENHSKRKWFGVIWLLIEVNLVGGTIFGFAALFEILPQYGIYGNCKSTSLLNNITQTEQGELSCEGDQTRHYQNALTLGIILFEIPSLLIGPLIDRFGCRTIKLIAM